MASLGMSKSMANKKFSLAISVFPESLHPVLNTIDDEGNGVLELDEITDVFTMYAEMKKAAKDGSIAISTLPKEIQPSLKVFDVDGDGSVAPNELARAAELYKESKNARKRLSKVITFLVLVMGVLLGCLAGMVIAVVEAAKETETNSSGVTFVKGSDTPAASGTVTNSFVIGEAESYDMDTLDTIESLRFTDSDNMTLSYTITGWYQAADSSLIFYSARGDTVSVSGGDVTVTDTTGTVLYTESASRRRSLLFFGWFDSWASGSGSSTASMEADPPAESPTPVPAPEPSPVPAPEPVEPTFSPEDVMGTNSSWMGGDAV